MSKALLASVFALAAAVPVFSLAGCSPEVPANPTYSRDVKPILMARCVRCHDETFRGDPAGSPNPGPPATCHLNRYENTGDCTATSLTCSIGASGCANTPGLGSYLAGKIDPSVDDSLRMPPLPADRLSDYEWGVLNRWMTNLDANGAPLP